VVNSSLNQLFSHIQQFPLMVQARDGCMRVRLLLLLRWTARQFATIIAQGSCGGLRVSKTNSGAGAGAGG
jgi:hypothetical protein